MRAVAIGASLPNSGPSTHVTSDDRSLTAQLELFSGAGGSLQDRWDAVRSKVFMVVNRVGLKEAAYQLDMSPSQLSHALAERDRRLPGEVLVWAASRPGPEADAIAGYFAAFRGRELTEPRAMTPEEELRAYKDAVAKNFGPLGAEMVSRDALGRK